MPAAMRFDVVMCWFVYFENNLAFPFEAECVEKRKISPLRKGEKVTAVELLSEEENLGGEFFVLIEWSGRKMGVPLAQRVTLFFVSRRDCGFRVLGNSRVVFA